jgi:enolase
MSATIKHINARQLLDSRGNPTVEADVVLTNGMVGRASVPSGASTGTREAVELRDNDSKVYLGKGVMKAVSNVRQIIAPALAGKKVTNQEEIDRIMLELDGTEYKSKLGANAMLAVSLASARAGAMATGKELFRYLREDLGAPNKRNEYVLPAPLMNIINGGAHASNNLDIQEFMIVPHLPMGFSANLRAGVEIFHHLKKVLSKKNHSTNVGDEGGFAPNLQSHEEAIDCIAEAIKAAGYHFGKEISLSLDCASSEFYENGKYKMQGKEFSSSEMIDYFQVWLKKYPIYSIEDGLAEQDEAGWPEMTKRMGKDVMLVGDDLFVTNPKIFKQGIERGLANALLVKVNQIGTLSETFKAIALCYQHNYQAIISHRSGETADSFIADLAVATGAGHIKTGSASRADRTEKYNQLLRIEESLGDKAIFHRVK